MKPIHLFIMVMLMLLSVVMGYAAGKTRTSDKLQMEAVKLHYAHFVPINEHSSRFEWFTNAIWQTK